MRRLTYSLVFAATLATLSANPPADPRSEREPLPPAPPQQFEPIPPPAVEAPPLPPRVFTYADAVALAVRDAARLDPYTAAYTTYLFVPENDPIAAAVARVLSPDGAMPPEQAVFRLMSGHVNFLSRKSRLAVPALVMDFGWDRKWDLIGLAEWKGVRLLRLNVLDYGWDKRTWDKLANPQLNPHFHVSLVKDWPGGVYSDGQTYAKGSFKYVDYALAPWLLEPFPPDHFAMTALRKQNVEALVAATQTRVPLIRWDSFLWASAIQFDRLGAGYYDWLGVKDQKIFDRLVGFDEKASEAFSSPQFEAVSVSGVAVQPRLVEWYEKIGGQYVRTKDQVNQRAIGDRNPLDVDVVSQGRLKADATEIFAHLPNGLWALGLFNLKDGTRQDSAPDGVGYFHQTLTNDGKIHAYLACIVCHDKQPNNGGLKSFTPYFRTLYARGNLTALTAVRKGKYFDPKELVRLEELLIRPIDPASLAKRRYIQALFEATGLAPHEYAAALHKAFTLYDGPVDLTRAAYDLQVDAETLRRQFAGTLLTSGKFDSVLADFLSPEGRRQSIGVDQWAERFSAAMLAVRGYAVK
ncbi:MAG: hypothetical protein KGL39_08050 [Patescibacteria group bacterium]|nr:hypothetical protein [Patescibacteria group bacterium]